MDDLQMGDYLPAALWFNDDHPKERDDAKRGITTVLEEMAQAAGVRVGPIEWEELDPLSPKLKDPPPDHFQGDIKCMVGTVVVAGILKQEGDFTSDLEAEDLETLRNKTRTASGANLTDEECDEIINAEGPMVAADEAAG
jgi:hypothetical protein